MGTLYLIPNTLGKTPNNNTIPDYVLNIIRSLDVFVVENIQSAVSYLQWVGDTVPDYKIDFLVLDKDTPDDEAATFLDPLKHGKDVGLISEAGVPAVADPGSRLVKMAHAQEIDVIPLVGPSSILLALMASGFNGQQFCFHGYLPIDPEQRKKELRKLERESSNRNYTQIFMEAPHRNDELVESIIETCRGETLFCTATNLTLPGERIISRTVNEWKQVTSESIQKEPTIFLLYAGRT